MAKQSVVSGDESADPKRRRRVRESASKQEFDKTNLAAMTSRFLAESCLAARNEYGDSNIAVGGEACRIVTGLPLPGLAFEYLIQNDVWPLSRLTQIVGHPGACKSALTFEMARWFREAGGISYLFENETKYSPDYALSIIGYPRSPDEESLLHVPCRSVDDWQTKILTTADWVRTQMTRKEVGRIFPVLMILDSLMGKLSEESQARIERDGHADRSHPHEALQINSFMKKFPQDLEEWPMCFVFTNHLKERQAETGPHKIRGKAGGKSPDFAETFELELKRDAAPNIKLVDETGFEVCGLKLLLACKKNSLGETDRKISVEVRWVHREDPDTGLWRQYTRWDWPAATTKLLGEYVAGKGHRRDKIMEVVDIHGNGNKWYSKDLGVPSTDPVSAHDLGVLLERDVERKSALRKLFGIKERKHFEPGRDYLAQLEELRNCAEAKMTVKEQ